MFFIGDVLVSGDSILYGYGSPIVAIGACAIFYFGVNCIKIPILKWIKNIDRLCFGAYIVHACPIQFTYRIVGITPLDFGHQIVAMIFFGAAFTIAAFIGSFVLSLIPPLKKYVL